MTPAAKIIRLLRAAGPAFHTAEWLGQAAALSPEDAVAELRALEAAGFQFEVLAGAGWRLIRRPDALIADDIEASLAPGPIDWRIRVFRETASTNDIIDKAGRGGEAEGFAVFAESQTAGRGRMGRTWESRPGLGLWCSALLRPPWPASQAGRLTVIAAVAVAEAVAAFAGVPASIKWPNDVLVRGRKIAGILTELRCTDARIDYAVVGIGLNVRHAPEDLPARLLVPATSLAIECPPPPHRADLAAAILDRLALGCAEPFDDIRRRWIRLCSTLGRTVELRDAHNPFRGIAESIDPDGALLVRDPSGQLHAVNSGDVLHIDPLP